MKNGALLYGLQDLSDDLRRADKAAEIGRLAAPTAMGHHILTHALNSCSEFLACPFAFGT
jgi:hypothetical protein